MFDGFISVFDGYIPSFSQGTKYFVSGLYTLW